MRKTKEQNKGITLIALVITIIVMLILVGVTISMAVNGGLFEKAGEAASKTNNAVDAEQALSNGAITVGGEYYNSLGEYVSEKQKEVALISFTIDGVMYNAEEGMTWGEWVSSKYNTIGAVVDTYPDLEIELVKVLIDEKDLWIAFGAGGYDGPVNKSDVVGVVLNNIEKTEYYLSEDNMISPGL